jgi:hypothetical protein
MGKLEKEQYKAEGLRRMQLRKEKRRDKYLELVKKANDNGVPNIGGIKNGCWPDPDSPTGYSQVCSWQGICQSPCNGDC